jgi:hypothetical protein
MAVGEVPRILAERAKERPAWDLSPALLKKYGGEGGIRTPGTVSRTPVFKTGAFNRSATSPATTVLLQSSDSSGLIGAGSFVSNRLQRGNITVQWFSSSQAGSEPFRKFSTLLLFSTGYKSVHFIGSVWK